MITRRQQKKNAYELNLYELCYPFNRCSPSLNLSHTQERNLSTEILMSVEGKLWDRYFDHLFDGIGSLAVVPI